MRICKKRTQPFLLLFLIPKIQSGKSILAYIFYTTSTDRTILRKELIPVAKRYRGYVQFVTIDALEYGHMASALNLKGSKFPAFVVHSMFNDQVFVYDQTRQITGKEVDEFVLGILQGKISASSERGTKNDHRDEL
jgi:protein disulfide-isomerase A1